jgi:hypothetical protein
MTTRIEKDFYFQTGVHFENKFYVNSYDVTLSLLVETDSIREQNVAMDRATHFLTSVLQNSLLINSKETEAIEKYKNAGLKICILPEDPYDQILSMVLLQKLNAVMEGRLRITDLVIGSTLSEGVRFTMVSEVAENVLDGNYWWNKPTICLNNEEACPTNKTNIVKLFDDSHWVDLGLSWKEKGKK